MSERQKRATLYNGPKSVCVCGHLGDGDGLTKEGNPSAHAGLKGHGMCVHGRCKCVQFTWDGYTREFENYTKGE